MSKKVSVEAENRSMDVHVDATSEVFFFPKRSRPVSVRASTREEAEQSLEAESNNPQEK